MNCYLWDIIEKTKSPLDSRHLYCLMSGYQGDFSTWLLLHFFQDTPRHADSVGRCLLKPARNGGAVSDGAKSRDTGLEIRIDYNLVGVEFYFHTVKQCLVAGDTRGDLV